MRKSEEMKNVRFSAECVELLTIMASQQGLRLAEVLEAMTYGYQAQAAVIPGAAKGARWIAFRVVNGPGGEIAFEAVTAASVQQLGERLGVYGCNPKTHQKAA